MFSLHHDTVKDTVVDGLHPYLEAGDIIIDANNENWENTQLRQGKMLYQKCILYQHESIRRISNSKEKAINVSRRNR